MLALARNGLTEKQVWDALHARIGIRSVRFRFYIIRNGVRAGSLPAESGSVRYSAEDEIQRTASFTFRGETALNWLADEIQPSMEILVNGKWAEFPLGVFVPSTPTRNIDGHQISYTVEAYDRTIYAKEDCITERAFYPAGTDYLNVIQQLILSCGIPDVKVTATSAVLPTDREFEIGTSKLEIINTLLSEINYLTLSIDANGNAVLAPYIEPSAENVSYTYRADELSVLQSAASSTADFYNVPNIYIAVVSNPEQEAFRSVYINDNPASELSTVRRGRNIVSELYKPDAIASQEELDIYIRRIAFSRSQIYETASIHTALMPMHEGREVLEIRHPEISGIFEEIGWEMDLQAGGAMQHSVRRIVQI
ncbi:MAG: hypothetical protein ACOX6P_11515 [Candidatus Merdivicinus sp.]|jgi:hypothetical protein